MQAFVFRLNYVTTNSTMIADALAPDVTKSSTAMVLTMGCG